MLDDGLINKTELIEICSKLIRAINTTSPGDLEETFKMKLDKVTSIGDKAHYDKLPLNSSNSFIDFGGLFSIFEVQKQNIINDYGNLMELEGININLEDLQGHSFQPISSVETDPSQQSVLHSLEATRNILIQGPPGTGKSQTLTAVLINSLENNKKTIVVCEKLTALKVLHDALTELGLASNCAIIKDIVKDRGNVVDSVRDRIGSKKFLENKICSNLTQEKRLKKILELNQNVSNIKSNLNYKQKLIQDLITKINNKHQKLDKKLLGNKNWTQIVGELLAELKGNTEDFNLYIEKNVFDYFTQELNSWLEIIQKGQLLYSEFLPIEPISFLNPEKLVGENPFLIEQSISEDFDDYSKQLEQIKNLIETTRSELINLRNIELQNQIVSITNCIDEIDKKESELSSLLLSAKEIYCHLRNSELTEQLEAISPIIENIKSIFYNNKNNLDLTNTEKVNSFGFKLWSVFSKEKKQTIIDQRALRNNLLRLDESLKTTKDFLSLNFTGSLESIKNTLQALNQEISNIKNESNNKIENEFASFKLDLILTTLDSNEQFSGLNSEINNPANSENFRTKLQLIQCTFENYLSEINALFQQLFKQLIESKDVKLNYRFDKSYHENKELLPEIKQKIERIKTGFDSKIQKEFNALNLLKPSKLAIESIAELQKKFKFLKEQIVFDNWVSFNFRGDNLTEFIQIVSNIIERKNLYFNGTGDYFLIEFKWFQFYNSLSETQTSLINQLKSKKNWRKVFLVNYLNALLISSANLDLPTNDDEHKELSNTLNGVEKEQLKFIKEFWFSKQIDSTREFEQKNINLSVENLYNKRSSNRFKRLSLRQIVQYDANLFTNFFPIILTSPDVASNLFKGMNSYFDIVIFDEASQLRLEDNLPAILKGKQVVIAGDEHQMPPSNYFSKIFDGTVEDEDDVEDEESNQVRIDKDDILLSCESLLDFGSE